MDYNGDSDHGTQAAPKDDGGISFGNVVGLMVVFALFVNIFRGCHSEARIDAIEADMKAIKARQVLPVGPP